jgi:Predicted transcriptional regulators
MEPSEFLDILGNENRRKILALLADRPYYVSEISTRLGVAPKAVIGHLSLLENSGLIESNTDDQRRKYYSISKSLRLEVSVSPYSYSVHVNNIKLEMPDDPVYSLSLSFDAPRAARKKHFEDMPTGPVIHLASSYGSNDFSNEGGQSGGFTIEIIGPNHPFYGHVGILKDGGKALLESENSSENSFSKSDDGSKNPFSKSDSGNETAFSNSDDGNENTFSNFDDGNDNIFSKTNPQSRLQSREGYFLSRIFQVRDDLENLWDEQQKLSRLQEDLTVRQSRLMNSFVHCATQLSDDKIDLDILFRLLKNDMSAAELCYATGHAPSLVLPRLKIFENKNMVEKYLLGGDFFWRLKDGSDL